MSIEIIKSRSLHSAKSFGPIVILWSEHHGEPKITRIVLSTPKHSANELLAKYYPHTIKDSCSVIDRVAERMEAFLAGGGIRFSLESVRMDLCKDFQRRVLVEEHSIPRGRVSSYHRIAQRVGNPRAARAVGTALAKNPFPIIIPCHRVVRSDGTLGGYYGGVKMKKTLLEMEGIEFNLKGKIISQFFY
ncbi:MGMT family protein [bacterium]|nr:MGMT family protein [bacterium]